MIRLILKTCTGLKNKQQQKTPCINYQGDKLSKEMLWGINCKTTMCQLSLILIVHTQHWVSADQHATNCQNTLTGTTTTKRASNTS